MDNPNFPHPTNHPRDCTATVSHVGVPPDGRAGLYVTLDPVVDGDYCGPIEMPESTFRRLTGMGPAVGDVYRCRVERGQAR